MKLQRGWGKWEQGTAPEAAESARALIDQVSTLEQSVRAGAERLQRCEEVAAGADQLGKALRQQLQECARADEVQQLRSGMSSVQEQVGSLEDALGEKACAEQLHQLRRTVAALETQAVFMERVLEEKASQGLAQQLQGLLEGLGKDVAGLDQDYIIVYEYALLYVLLLFLHFITLFFL